MKQAGHKLITQHAVHRLFESHAGGGRLLGLSEPDFFRLLNAGQARADRITGDTWHPFWSDPDAQRRHSMADPSKSAHANVDDIKHFIVDQLRIAKAAHERGDSKGEFRALGAAVHALEDSYSGGHMYRDPNAPSDPFAPIQSINIFSPLDIVLQQTHINEFDDLMQLGGRLERGTDQAAVQAVNEVMNVYLQELNAPQESALDAYDVITSRLYQTADDLSVNTQRGDPDFVDARDAQYANEVCRDWSAEATSKPDDGSDYSQ